MTIKRIAFFDLDNTIYDIPAFLPLSEYQFNKGLINSECVAQLKNDISEYKSGKISYEDVVSNITVHWSMGLKGADSIKVCENANEYFSSNIQHFYPYVKEVFELLKPTHNIYLVTAEPDFVGKTVSELFSLTGYFSSILEKEKNTYTGNTISVLSSRESKAKVIKDIMQNHTKVKSIAFGDSEGDLEMLRSVEIAICVNPSDNLKAEAVLNNWKIVGTENVAGLIKDLLKE